MRANIERVYKEVSDRLDRVNFDNIWPPFTPFPFALYNSEIVVFKGALFPRDERFFANTTIEYDGEQIAIWCIDDCEKAIDYDLLAANIVHEMFHAFQKRAGETRFPDDLALLMYPKNPENLALKIEENCLLAAAIYADDAERKISVLQTFCSIRKFRENLIGDFTRLEYLAEVAEGSAEYAGFCALSSLSPAKALSLLNSYCELISNPAALQLNVRRISYYTGMLLLVLSARLGIDIDRNLRQSKTIYELIFQEIDAGIMLPPCQTLDMTDSKAIISAYEAKVRSDIDNFLSLSPDLICGDYKIVGYDPMNMRRIGDQVICTTFIMLENLNSGSIEKYFGTTFMRMKPGESRLVEAFCNASTELW